MVDFYEGDELVCLSMPSLMEYLKDLLILLLEDLILHRYLVILSLQLFDFSLKSKLLSFFLSLLRTRHGKVSFCMLWLSSLPMLERGAWSKESVRMMETSLTELERVGISVIPTDGAKC
ncbi:hypothetical protein COP1_040367 [Malus domestica]